MILLHLTPRLPPNDQTHRAANLPNFSVAAWAARLRVNSHIVNFANLLILGGIGLTLLIQHLRLVKTNRHSELLQTLDSKIG